tara:strand:- start:1081 stop:1818 length:738 start_codon:yes stop_codon:yes gene_type:complete
MKILILAAGSGTRLGKQTEKLPKSLIKINKKTILERQLEIFKKSKIDDITIIAGPNKEKFLDFGLEIWDDTEYMKHEQLGSLISINKIFQDDVVVIFSDIIFDERIFQKIIQIQCDFGIALDKNWEEKYNGRTEHPISQADLVEVQNGKIKKIKKNLLVDNAFEFIGIMKFSSFGWRVLIELCKKLKESHEGNFHSAKKFSDSYITDIIQELIELDYNVKPIFVNGNWLEIDTLQDVEIASKKLS